MDGFTYVYYRKMMRGRISKLPFNGMFMKKGVRYDCGWYETAKLAGRSVDLKLIGLGFEPKNGLKRVSNGDTKK